MVNLKGRSFLTLMDFTEEEIRYLLDLSHDLKAKKKAGIFDMSLKNKNIVLLFEKASTRTRCAFEVAAFDEGARVTFLDSQSSHMGKKESLEDTAKVLGRFYDGIEYRGFNQSVVEDLAKYSGVPVWNGLTDVDHPTQILADLMTIEENISKPLRECKVVFCGDIRNNMAYAWMYGCAKMGVHFIAYGPEGLKVDENVLKVANEAAAISGGKIEVCHDASCLDKADVLCSDVWVSMGEEHLMAERSKLLSPYRITKEMMDLTNNPDVIFLHCLPSFHNFDTITAKSQMDLGIDIREVTEEVFLSKNSKVFDESENRMHTIKAVMVATI